LAVPPDPDRGDPSARHPPDRAADSPAWSFAAAALLVILAGGAAFQGVQV